LHPRQDPGLELQKQAVHGSSHDDADGAAGECDHKAFGQKLRHESAPSGPDRGAQGHLPPAARGACEEHVSDVDAGDQ
jgi:hypothetical protein